MAWLFSPLSGAQSLLLDDFSIPQQGIVTDVFAAFDVLEDPNLFLGAREIWGGGSAGCQTSMMSATVQEGEFRATSSEDCPGTPVVTWPRLISEAELDLSEYSGVLVDVTSVTGEVGITIVVALKSGQLVGRGITVPEPGRFSIELPEDARVTDAMRISLTTAIGFRESIALDAVWFVIPEPTVLASLATTLVLSCVAGCRRLR